MLVNIAAPRVEGLFRTSVFLALASVLALAACQRASETPSAEIRPVRATKIEQHAINGTVTLIGRIQAQTETNQSFRIDGKLLERTVDIGDRVVPGQVLAQLDALNEQSNLQSAQAQLNAAQSQLIEARSSYTRMRELVAQDAVSQAAYERSEAQLGVAQSQVASVQSLVSLAQNRLSYTRLMSTVAGVVTARGAEAGEVVAAGRMVVQVAQEDVRDAIFDVPAQVKDRGSKNPEITVALSSDPTVTASGRIREIAPRADPVTGTFSVRVQLHNPPAAMRLGSTVTGKMSLDSATSIALPSSALIRSEGKPAVWLIDSTSSTVSLRPVAVHAYEATRVQIEKGLAPGDMVVTAGVQALRSGQKIRLLGAQP